MANSYGSWRTGPQIDNIYPIGSIYLSTTSTNPGSLFGGSWELITGKFLLACDSTYTAGSTGGAATMAHTHSQVAVTTGASSAANSGGPNTANTGATTLSVSLIPSHTHEARILYNQSGYGNTSRAWEAYINSIAAPLGSTSATAGTLTDKNTRGLRDTSYTGGGGSHTHTLNSHTHTIAHTHDIAATTTGAASNTNNMPPYLAVYVWKRIS